MKSLVISASRSTPTIDFDAYNNNLKIEGIIIPNNANEFFYPIYKWLKRYMQEVNNDVKINLIVNVPYMNSSGTKALLNLFDFFEDEYYNGKNIDVLWYFNKENDIMEECGRELKEDLELPFKLYELEE